MPDQNSDSILLFQTDMRRGYLSGAPGILVSGLVWGIAAATTILKGNQAGVAALFAGGVVIFPISVLLCKRLGRAGAHRPGNPLGRSAVEGTVFFVACLPAAYAASRADMHWFFPSMLAIIGGRYVTFHTLYGTRFYWALGAALALAALALVLLRPAVQFGALAGAAIELAASIVLFARERSKPA
jgi:hypothetical protein